MKRPSLVVFGVIVGPSDFTSQLALLNKPMPITPIPSNKKVFVR
jgi:hypothetical protein